MSKSIHFKKSPLFVLTTSFVLVLNQANGSAQNIANQHHSLNHSSPHTTNNPPYLNASKIQPSSLGANLSGYEVLFQGDSYRETLRSGGHRSYGLNDPPYEQLLPAYGDDFRVPFWNIAHMINSIGQIQQALRSGANGIEVDISFDRRGVPIETYHGFPCDCGRHCHYRENFVDFLSYVGGIASPSAQNRLLLIILDLKLKDLNGDEKVTAGLYLASMLHRHIYERYENDWQQLDGLVQPPVRVIISINHVTDSVLIRSFLDQAKVNGYHFMTKHVGFDVGMNDNLNEISLMWNELNGITSNIWQGDGLTNCANIIRGVDRLKDAISVRNGQGHFRKIYYWTADILYQIRTVLRLGIDAILTNRPERVRQALEEPEFRSKYRLATPFDDPFAQFWIKPSAWKVSPPSLSEAIETVSNIKQTSANFVRTIPDGIVAALKKVRESIVSIR